MLYGDCPAVQVRQLIVSCYSVRSLAVASCNRAGLNTHVPGASLNFVRVCL